MHELPAVALTTRFPALCQEYRADRLCPLRVFVGVQHGVLVLPGDDPPAS